MSEYVEENKQSPEGIPSSSKDITEFRIQDFLEDNYALFTVLSIFGAISIYIFGLREGLNAERPVVIGFISSQFLLLLSAYAIYKRIINRMGGMGNIFEYILMSPSKGSLELAIFLVSFTGLVGAFVSVSTEFIGTVSLLLQIIAAPLGFGTTVGLLELLNEETRFSLEFDEEDTKIEMFYKYISISVVTVIILGINKILLNEFDPNTVFGIPETNVFDPIAWAFFMGSTFVGITSAMFVVFSLLNYIIYVTKKSLRLSYLILSQIIY